MKREVYKIVGFIYGITGVVVAILNIVNHRVYDREFDWLNIVYIGIGVIFILLTFTKNSTLSVKLGNKRIALNYERFSTLTQFFVMNLICTSGIIQSHRDPYALSMLLLAGLMGLKYRILKRWSLITLLVFYAVLFEVSAQIAGVAMRGLYISLFASFFFGIAIIMYREDLQKQFELTKKYHARILTLQTQVDKITNETIDLDTINFTPRELEILEYLCIHQATNQEIAEHFNITVQTVKTHLRNIFDKAGVDDRHQCIDLFKLNFIVKDEKQAIDNDKKD